MPFKKIDANKEIEDKLKNDSAFAKAYRSSEKEFELIKKVIMIRNSIGLSQKDLAEKVGIKQQVVSRLENKDNSPTLRNFLKIIDGLGLELELRKKR